MGGICAAPSNMHLMTDKYKTHDELIAAIRAAGVESIQTVLGFDFSGSNGSLHSTDHENPYMCVLRVVQPILEKFDDDGEINAYRFGCAQSCDQRVVPLLGNQETYKGFQILLDSYIQAAKSVQQAGPTTFAHTIQKAVELEQKMGGKQFMLCVLITDGGISNETLDRQALEEASAYPIAFVGIGVGNGPFGILENMDDKLKGKFDNFQFVNFNEIESISKTSERPDLTMATALLNEVPEAYKAMKKLGYV